MHRGVLAFIAVVSRIVVAVATVKFAVAMETLALTVSEIAVAVVVTEVAAFAIVTVARELDCRRANASGLESLFHECLGVEGVC